MAENGYGDHTTSLQKLMAEHDALHPDLRRISCFAVAKWHAGSIVEVYCAARKAGGSHAYALRYAARCIGRCEVEDTLADYGPNHPEAMRA